MVGFVATQDEYSLLARGIEDALLPAIERHRLSLVPYFPLAGGALSGKYRKGQPMPEGARHTKGQAGADRFLVAQLGHDREARPPSPPGAVARILELAMSWLARRPAVASIITGATKPEQIDANVAAVGWALTPEDLSEVDRITLAV